MYIQKEFERRSWFTAMVTRPQFVSRRASRAAVRLPNVRFRTHDGREVHFYDDLIRGKQVVINFMYAGCHGTCPAVTSKLVAIHKALQDRVGRDLFFYSISIKPDQDTPSALKAYAQARSADRPGWTFLTGGAYDTEAIRFQLFRARHAGIGIATHAGALRIINDATNVWTTAEAFASLETTVQHIRAAALPKSVHAGPRATSFGAPQRVL
jgi:protein SCO1/2